MAFDTPGDEALYTVDVKPTLLPITGMVGTLTLDRFSDPPQCRDLYVLCERCRRVMYLYLA